MRELLPRELELISGGFGECETDAEETGEIVVCAPDPPPPPPPYYPPPTYPPTYPPSGGSSGGGGGNSASDLPYDNDCASAGQAADGIRDAITGTMALPPDETKPSWINTEYGALIVENSAGNFGAYNDTIYTDGLVNRASIPEAPSGTVVAGILHNHPDAFGGDSADAILRYPSSTGGYDDWDALQAVYDKYSNGDTSYDPSLWIVDSNGEMREFKLSDRAYFEGLTAAERVAGIGLPAPSTEQSCGS